jgi:thiol-disulfide isomerase/thioredoxin
MLALAVGLVFNVPQLLQRLVPDYTASLQQDLTDNPDAQRALRLGGLVNDENKNLDKCASGAKKLESCGVAPSITGIAQWINTPDGAPIGLSDLRGKVVLIDFWAYSCINCQRSIPHVVAWDRAYRSAGLEVIGIHSPEYAFEKDAGNVIAGAKDFGITYPVALDNSLATWTNYRNRYWPAHYLIDAQGVVRHISFGEGGYATTEKLIRELLTSADEGVRLPPATEVTDTTPEVGSTTPETFLGSTKASNFGGSVPYRAGQSDFKIPSNQPPDTFALGGSWSVGTQSATPATNEGVIRLDFHATTVRLVLAGSGTVQIRVDGSPWREIRVGGTPRSYVAIEDANGAASVLEVRVPRGVDVYSFTYG